MIGIRALAFALLLGAAATPVAQAREPIDVRADFVRYDPDYRAKRTALSRRLEPLRQRMTALEQAGEPMTCAQQVLTEVRWRLSNTADFAAIGAGIDRLDRLLAHPEADRDPDRQDPGDGAWGRCFAEWFLRLDASYDQIATLADAGQAPALAPRFLDRVNDPDRLEAFLMGAAVSDVPRDGINRRRELNEGLADLMRLILAGRPAGYAWHPGLKDRLLALVTGPLRDPATGFWGETYRRGEQRLRMADLSVTFHVVRYLHGQVSDWPRLLDTLLAIKPLPYPQGWIEADGYLAHDLYDVAALFRMGWPYADAAQQDAIRRELAWMVDWCLSDTVHADGTITVKADDDSVETAAYFAVSLLDEAGYFDPARRFWTDRAFPDAARLGRQLADRLRSALAAGAGGAGGVYYRSALDKLAAF